MSPGHEPVRSATPRRYGRVTVNAAPVQPAPVEKVAAMERPRKHRTKSLGGCGELASREPDARFGDRSPVMRDDRGASQAKQKHKIQELEAELARVREQLESERSTTAKIRREQAKRAQGDSALLKGGWAKQANRVLQCDEPQLIEVLDGAAPSSKVIPLPRVKEVRLADPLDDASDTSPHRVKDCRPRKDSLDSTEDVVVKATERYRPKRRPGTSPGAPAKPDMWEQSVLGTKDFKEALECRSPFEDQNASTETLWLLESSDDVISIQSRPELPVLIPRFDGDACGASVVVSEDGYTVRRASGTKQCMAIGDGPLECRDYGVYYELEIVQTLVGWIGAMALGVTHTPSQELASLPDKAWQIPRTFILGYRGSAFVNGEEHSIRWCAENLPKGTRLGVLVDREGLTVSADGEVMWTLPCSSASGGKPRLDLPIYPIVDIVGGTQGVTLSAPLYAPGSTRHARAHS